MREPGYYWVRFRATGQMYIGRWYSNLELWIVGDSGGTAEDTDLDFIADKPLEPPDMPAREQQ